MIVELEAESPITIELLRHLGRLNLRSLDIHDVRLTRKDVAALIQGLTMCLAELDKK